MKIKTLAWSQIIIAVLLFAKVLAVFTNVENGFGFNLGSTFHLILIALFALLTGLYNLDRKK